jgi:hypothetical protein
VVVKYDLPLMAQKHKWSCPLNVVANMA